MIKQLQTIIKMKQQLDTANMIMQFRHSDSDDDQNLLEQMYRENIKAIENSTWLEFYPKKFKVWDKVIDQLTLKYWLFKWAEQKENIKVYQLETKFWEVVESELPFIKLPISL